MTRALRIAALAVGMLAFVYLILILAAAFGL